MNIALVYPECYDISHFGLKRKEIPPFGVLYLAAAIEEKGVNVTLFRASNEECEFDFSSFKIIGFNIASSVTYPIIKKTKENSRFNKNSLLIAGGIHASLFPKEVMEELGLQAICLAEGESVIKEIIDNFNVLDLKEIKGLAYKENGDIAFTEKRPFVANLDEISFPARHLIPTEDIIMANRLSKYDLKIAHIICSRGCSYRCRFCANQTKDVRYRSGKNIRKELEFLIDQYGIEGFCISDDNFVVDKRRVREIIKEIAPLKLKWTALSRVDTIDVGLLSEFRESGCVEIKYGVESGSQRILNLMNKKVSVEQIKNTISTTYLAGIKVKVFLLHGFPGENIESTRETISLLDQLKNQIDRISLFRFVPLPGSEVYSHSEKYDLELPKNFEDIFIYNNSKKWWGTDQEKEELEQAYLEIADYLKLNWEHY